MKKLASLLTALMLAFALASCGESDDDEVRALIGLLIKTDPAVCDSMTTKFVHQLWRGPEDCKTSVRENELLKKARIGKVAVDGDKATVTVISTLNPQSRGQYALVKRDGAWTISGLGSPAGSEANKTPPKPKPKIQKGLDAGETVEAYYQAIKDGDGAALCGLISRGYAIQLRGGEKTDDPISDCVDGLKGYDWSKTQKGARGVKVVRVSSSVDKATVTLSQGKRVLLKKPDGRWLIDDMRSRR